MRDKKAFLYFIALILLFFSCSNDENKKSDSISSDLSNKIFKTVDVASSNLNFTNEVKESTSRNSMFFDYFLNGGGVAVGDLNNDGLADIFFTGNDVPNKMFINEGNLKFKDISQTALPNIAKWSTGANMVDINNDGFLDIYVCSSGIEESDERLANQFLINNGDLTFTDKARKYGIAGNSKSVHSSFFDYDNDGDLDLWVNNHMDFDGDINAFFSNANKSHNERSKYRSTLYENQDNKFVDVTEKAGVSRESVSLGLSTVDFNNDGFIDVYVSNDYDIPDYYFMNNGNGTFTEVSKDKMGHTSFYSMGIDAADLNNDGLMDMVAVDMTPQDHVRNKTLMASMDSRKFNFLYDQKGLTKAYMFNTVQIGRGNGAFSEVSNFMGTGQTEWSWAPLLADFDNDGFKDLYITNGYFRDTKDNDFKRKVAEFKSQNGDVWNDKVFDYFMEIIKSSPVKNRIFQNQNGRFQDITSEWSDLQPTFSNGGAYADFDNDGDLDIVINNLSQTATLLENISSGNNFLKVKLKSDNQLTDNAVVSLQTDAGLQSITYTFSRGYQSSVEPIAHFGLGKANSVNGVKVKWTDGSSEIFNIEGVNRTVTLEKGNGSDPGEEASIQPLLESSKELFTEKVRHEEMRFNDFNKEILLPHKYSDLGPALAVADINGDGMDDVFLGGSNTSEPQLFISQGGKLKKDTKSTILNDRRFEDLGAIFFDYDNDGDQDLYVASGGGGEIEGHPELMQDRLYQNDGKGNFTSKISVIPPISSSTKAIATIDVDKDGDLDLVVGGRNQPGKYPLSSTSYYLENYGEYFRKKTSKVLPELPGMITDIEAVDINGDDWEDLIITSEWNAPKILINNAGKFEELNVPALQDHSGWWQSVVASDFDKDGDMDFILGNMGENSKFHPSTDKPLGVLASDFDESGSLDIVLTKKYKDETVPVRGKECSSQQMPLLKDKFPTYEGFATSSIEDILGEAKIESSYSKSVNDFSSYVVINNGDKGFEMRRLPDAAQWFPIMDMEVSDVNKDGHLDLFLVGNKLNAEPETPSYDAGRGLILLGDGKMNFEAIKSIEKSGINIKGDARAIKSIMVLGKKYYIIASNNGSVVVYK